MGLGLVKNHNFRFHLNREADKKAWDIIHGEEVSKAYKSQNDFVIAAVNDYYDRHISMIDDPYLETREKEDAFADRIVNRVEKKVLSNLPTILGSFFMNQIQNPAVSPIQQVTASAESDNEPDPEENDLIDFDAFG